MPRAGTARRGLARQAGSVRRLGKGRAVGHPSLAAKKGIPPLRYARSDRHRLAGRLRNRLATPMFARWIATVAALLLACAQASAHVRSERATDLGTFAAHTEHALEIQRSAANASPGELPTNPKTAPPARASLENSASGENASITHCHAWENWSPLKKCASGVDKYLYANGNPGSYVDSTGQYAEAGHYYTVFIAAKEAGYSTERALTIALYAQLPDEIGTYEAINQATSTPVRLGLSTGLKGLGPVENTSILDVNNVQGGLHSLSGHDSRAMTDAARSVLINAQTDEAAGLEIHPFGDSYSHRVPESEGKTFPQFVGHLIPGAAPDRIVERPRLYAKYVRDLVESLAAREKRHIDMERSTEFANSMAAMAEEPIAAANLRIEESRNGLLSVFGPTLNRDKEMERAEKELTERLRERALRLITVQEREDGQILLQPERNRLGHFAGTLGHEQSQLAAFYESSLRGKPLEDSMYTDHSDASQVSSRVEAHIESMFKACQQRTCFDHDEGIRVPSD